MTDQSTDSAAVGALAAIEDAEARRAILALFDRAREFVMDHQPQKGHTGRPHIVLVSRRLACLYAMLVEADDRYRLDRDGLCHVVFDRVIDGKIDWSGGAALVIDDVLVFGSTLRRRVASLVDDPSVGTVHAAVAVIDEDRKNPHYVAEINDLVGHPLEGLARSKKEIARLGENIATCLYQSLTPYFTDFPLVNRIDGVPADAPERLAAAMPSWMAADVSLRLDASTWGQDDSTTPRALSFIPTKAVADSIISSIAPLCRPLLGLAKVRVYFTGVENGTRSMRVVPIGVPRSVDEDDLGRVLSQLREHIQSGLDWHEWTGDAQHRLIQMYLSAAVLTEFWPGLQTIAAGIGVAPSPEDLDRLHLSCYFEEGRVNTVLEAFAAAVSGYRTDVSWPDGDPIATRSPTSPISRHHGVRRAMRRLPWQAAELQELKEARPPTRPEPGKISRVELLWAKIPLTLWGEIVEDFHHDVQAVLAASPGGPERARYEAEYRQLRSGFTIDELQTGFFGEEAPSDDWERAVISLLLDVGNDLGAAVPSTRNEAKDGRFLQAVYRQYRAGENAAVASSSVGDLALGLDGFDWLTRVALGIDRDATESQLSGEQRVRVDRLARMAEQVEVATTQHGSLLFQRLATVVGIEDGYVDIVADSLTNADRGITAAFPIGTFTTFAPQPEDTFFWTRLAGANGKSGQLDVFELA